MTTRGLFVTSIDKDTGVIKVTNSTTPGVPDGYYRVPIKQMDLVSNPGPGEEESARQATRGKGKDRDPFDTAKYGSELEQMIQLIEEYKKSGPNRPPIDLGPDWEVVSFEDYLKKFIQQHQAEFTKQLPRYLDLQTKNVEAEIKKYEEMLRQVNASIEKEKGFFKRSRARQLELSRDYISEILKNLNNKLADLNIQKQNPERVRQPIQLNKIFQEQLKNNMENTVIYRSGNVTLLVPAEYRNTPQKIKQLSKAVRLLQEKYGTKTPVEINIYTRSPGDVSGFEAVSEGGIWSVSGWTTNNNQAGEILIGIDGQNILTDINPMENEGWSMPARDAIPQELYTLAHEWGHARDFDSGGDESGERPLMSSQIEQYFKAHPELYERLVSRYGKSAVWEATAELFAQMFLQEVVSIDTIDIEQEILDILRQ